MNCSVALELLCLFIFLLHSLKKKKKGLDFNLDIFQLRLKCLWQGLINYSIIEYIEYPASPV